MAEHNNIRQNVRVAEGKEAERPLICPKFRELFTAGWHCTRSEVHMHKSHLRKRSSNTDKGQDIQRGGFRDFFPSKQKSTYI